MFGFDIYNFYSIAPSVAIIVASIVMVGYGIHFVRKNVIEDSKRSQSE